MSRKKRVSAFIRYSFLGNPHLETADMVSSTEFEEAFAEVSESLDGVFGEAGGPEAPVLETQTAEGSDGQAGSTTQPRQESDTVAELVPAD